MRQDIHRRSRPGLDNHKESGDDNNGGEKEAEEILGKPLHLGVAR